MSAKDRPPINPSKYSHSPAHHAVALRDHAALDRLIAALPRLAEPDSVRTESDSIAQQRVSDEISAVIDRRDVPYRETPLHLAVYLNDAVSAGALAAAGANYSLQNSAGWNPLQEALCRRCTEVGRVLLRHREPSAWAKWRRRLPRLIAELRRMRDFYMEIDFHFESSVIPFFSKMAPSDTYKIWKRDGNLRADTSLAGFDGMKIKRADHSLLFLGDGDRSQNLRSGSLILLKRENRKILDAFKHAGSQMSESEIAAFLSKTAVHRPGMDVSRAELVGRTNWRRQQVTETVGEWRSKVYEMSNVVIRCRIRSVDGSAAAEEADEVDDGGGSMVREKHAPPRHRRSSSSAAGEGGKKKAATGHQRRASNSAGEGAAGRPQSGEKESVKSLQPSVWLTDEFPLKTEELLPLLEILVNKVKAMRKMRELLATKFPPGNFPVKLAIPVVPSVRVVITFSKFVELQPADEFYTPPSSPKDEHKSKGHAWSMSSWSTGKHQSQQQHHGACGSNEPEPFAIPSGYTWATNSKKKKTNQSPNK